MFLIISFKTVLGFHIVLSAKSSTDQINHSIFGSTIKKPHTVYGTYVLG